MAIDVLVLNTAVVDIRRSEFTFADALSGEGGLAKCPTSDMPDYRQAALKAWIDAGSAAAGGPGNTAPLIARTGLKTAVGVNLGKGGYDGYDACGQFFYQTMIQNHVDMSGTYIHPELPTGITFIHDKAGGDRGGLVYFPNANNDFSFDYWKKQIERLAPHVVHYMYSGLSDRGDARGGKDLADFIAWCRGQGIITIVDSHTLTGNPKELIEKGLPVEAYRLLEPLLPVVDIFFTSSDECKMIENTLDKPHRGGNVSHDEICVSFLQFLQERFWKNTSGPRVLGVTVSNGAYHTYLKPDGSTTPIVKTASRYMAGGTVDLVGAGDSFRAGFQCYLAKNITAFKNGSFNPDTAVQTGNLMASLYVKAPLDNRYGNIPPYDRLQKIANNGISYDRFDALLADIRKT